MPPTKPLKKEESEDLFPAFNDIDWSQVTDSQLDTQLQTQTQLGTQPETQVETQTTLVGGSSLPKFPHSSTSPPVRTISTESGSSTQTNDSAKTLVVDDEDVDYEALLEGAENFDWSDWGTDEESNAITTPRKPKSPSKAKFTPVKSKNLRGMAVAGGAITPPPYTQQCTRCIVVNISDYKELNHPAKVSNVRSFPPVSTSGKSAGVKRVTLPPDAWSEIPNLLHGPILASRAGHCQILFYIRCLSFLVVVADTNP